MHHCGNFTPRALTRREMLARCANGFGAIALTALLSGKAFGENGSAHSGPSATDERNNRLLLEKLASVPLEKRTAYYTCYAALSDPQGDVRANSEGTCRGRILNEPAGCGGFGYDPLFEVIECHRTFGELAPAVKAVLSHRSRAIRLLVPQLISLLQSGAWPS